MRVRYKTLSAGPSGTFRPGDEEDVTENEARMLEAGGYAERLEPVEAEQPLRQERRARKRDVDAV